MVSRRDFFGITIGAGASLALTPELLGALERSGGPLIQRAIPSTGERLPVIALGRGSVSPSADHAALREVLRTLVDNGGSVLDTVHGNSSAEQVAGTIANQLGIQHEIFWSSRVVVAYPPPPPGTAGPPPKADPAAVKAQIEASLARFGVPRIDLVQVLAHADLPTHLDVLKELKREGRVRYIGVTTIAPQYAKLEAAMRNEPIDFVGIDYAIDHRGVEETILPLAQERKIGVLAYFPFGTGGLFRRAGTTPLPEWAADFDAATWAQFFLKYVIGHPAVTAVRTGTSQATHMLDNLGGGIGRLPNEATRRRMAALVDSWPTAGRAGG
jgi:aryl-alcohol dehydrogenase-like predicted oxidoreductase